MKSARFSLILIPALGLGACATTQTPDYTEREPGLKEKYVYAVNRDAQTRATRVYWVNYPSDEELAERLGLDEEERD